MRSPPCEPALWEMLHHCMGVRRPCLVGGIALSFACALRLMHFMRASPRPRVAGLVLNPMRDLCRFRA